jgi:acetyl-CoA acetyltransferase
MKEAIQRSGVDPKAINCVTVGNTIPTEGRFAYVARVASIQTGLPMESVAQILMAAQSHWVIRSAAREPPSRLKQSMNYTGSPVAMAW